jgi:hypothetical protein
MHTKSFLMGLSLAGAFILGCMAAQSPLVVPPARAGSDVQRWDYHCVRYPDNITQTARALGKEGWELAAGAGTASYHYWCFKRPL